MRELVARHRQLLTYLTGGVLSALLDVGLMQLLIVQGVNYVWATTAGFITGLLFNFAFHARMTFAAPMRGATFVRYLCVVGMNYLLTLACVSASVELAGMAVIGKLASLPLVAAIGFVLGKRWIFK
ncbi:MAG: GtrA family protein [Pseudomonadota bacterium]